MPTKSTVSAIDNIETPNLDNLSWRTALLSLAALTAVIGAVLGVAMFFNYQRQQQIVATYTSETNQLISQKPALFKQFFSKTFADCQLELNNLNQGQSKDWANLEVECKAAQNQLGLMGISQLKDSSAMVYLAYQNGNYQLIEASGKFHSEISLTGESGYFLLRNDRQLTISLANYFTDQKPMNLWQDFFYFIPGKEVLVPVVIDGQPVGYIFRGVIER